MIHRDDRQERSLQTAYPSHFAEALQFYSAGIVYPLFAIVNMPVARINR